MGGDAGGLTSMQTSALHLIKGRGLADGFVAELVVREGCVAGE